MPTGLILISIGAAVALLVVVWFFFFARKKPAERRTPTPVAQPVVPRPISPYSKAKPAEPPKDENLIQYGPVGQLNKPNGGETAAGMAAVVAAAAAPQAATKPMEDPPTVRDFPVEPDPPKPPAAAQKLDFQEVDTQREESTDADHEASHAAIEVSEPVPILKTEEVSAPPTLPELTEKELQILQVDLESVQIEPAAPPQAGEAGPDVESLPTIKLTDAPVPAPEEPKAEEEPVGADLPVISFDASVPLDLGQSEPGHAAEQAIAEAALPSIKLSEETMHLGGADDGGLNDLPELTPDLGEALPSIKLTDTSLEELEKMVSGVGGPAPAGGGGDGVRSIQLMEE
jgi:hypothetical protein